MAEVGVYELIGTQLKERIGVSIDNNPLNLVIARDEIAKLTQSLAENATQFKNRQAAIEFIGLVA